MTRSEQIRACEDTLARAAVELDELTLAIAEGEEILREQKAQQKADIEARKALGWKRVQFWRAVPKREDIREWREAVEGCEHQLAVTIGDRNYVTAKQEWAKQRLAALRRDRWHEDRRERAKAREQGMERAGHESRGR